MSAKLQSHFGTLDIERAGAADLPDVLSVIHDAADWRSSRGIPFWTYYTTEAGSVHVHQRIEQHEVFVFRQANGLAVGTLCIQWSDPDYWGARGDDGLAGYVHQLAIKRSVGGKGVGSLMLKWAISHTHEVGRPFARLDCAADNSVLCTYYQRHGFAQAGTVRLREFDSQLWERSTAPAASSHDTSRAV